MQSSGQLPRRSDSYRKETKGTRFCLPLLTLVCLALTWPLLFGGYKFEIQFAQSRWLTPEVRFLKQMSEQKQAVLEQRASESLGTRWHGSVPRGRKERGDMQATGVGRTLSELTSNSANGGQKMCHVDSPSWKQERVKVFVYELPARFTTDFYKHPSAKKIAHAAEWWIYQGIMTADPSGSLPAVRVTDAKQADVFFVPYMGSQAFLCEKSAQYTLPDHGEVCGDLKGKNPELVEELQQWLEQQEPWQRSAGIDHVFMLIHPLALYQKRLDFRRALFLLTDFAQAWSAEVSLTKDVVVPYMHVVDSLPAGLAAEAISPGYLQNLTTLLYFSGNLERVGMGAVRRQLADLLRDAPDVLIRSSNAGNVVSEERIRGTADEMRHSKFCLVPAGDTPSSSRLFDAIVNLCIPVIVSDDLELPFEDLLDYSEFSIVVKEAEAVQPGALLQQLRAIPEEIIFIMRRRLFEVRAFFEYEGPAPLQGNAVSLIWKEVAARVPSIRLRLSRRRRGATREQPATLDTLQPERDFHLAGNWSQ